MKKASFRHIEILIKINYRHGRGIYRYSNGDIYDGNWDNGKQHGEGLLLYKSGNRLQGWFSFNYIFIVLIQ